MRRYGYTWGDLQRLAQNRDDWKGAYCWPLLQTGLQAMMTTTTMIFFGHFPQYLPSFRMFRDFWLNLTRPSDKAKFTGRFGSSK